MVVGVVGRSKVAMMSAFSRSVCATSRSMYFWVSSKVIERDLLRNTKGTTVGRQTDWATKMEREMTLRLAALHRGLDRWAQIVLNTDR